MAKRSNESGMFVGSLGRLLGVALFILSTGALCSVGTAQQKLSHADLIRLSRQSCVHVTAMNGRQKVSSGSGFFVDPNLIVTCLHVVMEERIIDPNTKERDYAKWRPFPDILVVTDAGVLPCVLISAPTPTDPAPAKYDFAILQLKKRPTKDLRCVPLCQSTLSLHTGDDLYFSGFPLGARKLTHKGMLSGFTKDQAVLCIQAPINKGNSGGALLNTQGEVVGIISRREGGISSELDGVRKTIAKLKGTKVMTYKVGGVEVDPADVDRDIIDILDRYISTGIGYASNVSYVRDYLQKHGLAKPAAGTK